jgi:predicted DNA-binding transcriptional regulator AlpA
MMSKNELAANYIGRKELAQTLGERLRGRPYSEHTLIRWEKDGRGPPPTRVGRDVTYHIASVDTWLRSQEEKPATKSS